MTINIRHIIGSMHRSLVCVLVLALMGWNAIAQETHTYVQRGSKELKLDLYKAAKPRSDKAAVIYVYGGSFHGGARDNKECRRAAEILNGYGLTTICMDYRLHMTDSVVKNTSMLGFLAAYDTAITYAVEDCSAAIRYTVEHAEEWGIDPEKIILTGSSAGAITVLQTDYSRVNGLRCASEIPAGWKPAAVVSYAGAIYQRTGKIRYKGEPAPTLLWHGTVDKVVNYGHMGLFKNQWGGSDYLAKQFEKKHYPLWIMRFTERGHEVAAYLPYTQQEYMAFVDAVLSGRRMHYDATLEDEALKQGKWAHAKLIDMM